MVDISQVSLGENFLDKEFMEPIGVASLLYHTDKINYYNIKYNRRLIDYKSFYTF